MHQNSTKTSQHATRDPTINNKVSAFVQSHPGDQITPVGPGRTSTVHGCPSRWASCGWPKPPQQIRKPLRTQTCFPFFHFSTLFSSFSHLFVPLVSPFLCFFVLSSFFLGVGDEMWSVTVLNYLGSWVKTSDRDGMSPSVMHTSACDGSTNDPAKDTAHTVLNILVQRRSHTKAIW